MKKILSLLILTVVIISSLNSVIFADDWHPADEYGNVYVAQQCYADGYANTVNVFLSNYAEANITSYNSNTSEDVVLKGMYKHFELNAKAYPNYVAVSDSEYGRYISIDAAYFAKRTKEVYQRSINATALPSYSDGRIYYRADNADSAIHEIAAVDYIEYIANGVYKAHFDVYYSNQDVTSYYPYNSAIIKKTAGFTNIGSGECEFSYNGNPEYFDDLKVSAYRLISYFQNISNPQNANINTPCNPNGGPMVAETAPATEQTATLTPPQLEASNDTSTETDTTTADKADTKDSEATNDTVYLVVIAALIFAVLVVAIVLVIVLIKKKKKPNMPN